MMDILRMCPFCGDTARLHVADDGVKVMCTKCECRTPTYNDISCVNPFKWRENKSKNAVELAIETWNARFIDG